ncbi:MAG: hypothetical protein ABSA70_16580 [Terriglobia bacterium]
MNPEVPVPIRLAEIPRDILDEVRERLWTYTASVFAVDGELPLYRGTATCVAASGKPYLLTAAHVWRELRGERFALGLEADRLLIPIYKDLVEPIVLGPTGPPEWGPDLALIKLPDVVAADIRQVKAFYNLDKRRPEPGERAAYDEGLWAVIGAPAERSIFGEAEAVLKISLFASVVASAHQRDGFDYVDLGFYHQGRSNLPQSYGGLSGSGLWHAPITRSVSGVISWTGEARLEGVAFYQKFTDEKEGVIRCHGRMSVYEQVLRLVAKPRA